MAKRATPAQRKPPLRVVPKAPAKSSANPVKPPEGETATNGPDLESFHYHLGCITRAQAAVAAARKMLKIERRRASDTGINLGDLDLTMKMREEEPETVQATFKRMAQYANWMGLAPGLQGDLFEAADDKADAEKAAENEGYREGIEGVTASGDRYDTSSPVGQARLRGWNKGQEVLLTRFKPLEKPPEGVQKVPDSTQPAPQEQTAPGGATVQ